MYQPTPPPAALTIILGALAPDDAGRLHDAFQFAAAAHAGQLRDEGTPFIEHPVRVADILWSELGCRDVDVLAAALTHDTLEDCDWLGPDVLGGVIGTPALELVELVTKSRVSEECKPARDRAYLDALREAPHAARLLKLADRIDNLRGVLLTGDPAKAQRYLTVSRAEFIPLAVATDPAAERLVAAACDALESYLANTSV
jgi:(p)ppGpp synthase/HD superfamily hydrolase